VHWPRRAAASRGHKGAPNGAGRRWHSFTAQAVIAIEKVRLLSELRESLQQQTATADALRIISSFPGELKPVFATILDKALHLCEAAFGSVTTYDENALNAERGVPDALAAYLRTGIHQPRPGCHRLRSRRPMDCRWLQATHKHIEKWTSPVASSDYSQKANSFLSATRTQRCANKLVIRMHFIALHTSYRG
jgi:hypothetical protein